MKESRETSAAGDLASQARILAYGRLADEVRALLQKGQRPDAKRLARRHPELADETLELVPALAALEEIGAAPPELADEVNVDGTVLGDYRIVREVGRGGMGVVYEAWQASLERRVALKVLPFAAVLDKKRLLRFKNEARVAGTGGWS